MLEIIIVNIEARKYMIDEAISIFLLPNVSTNDPINVVIIIAPIRPIATTSDSICVLLCR
jgi:hypothetical protein